MVLRVSRTCSGLLLVDFGLWEPTVRVQGSADVSGTPGPSS